MAKKIFIGVAWPYANNSLHLGHVSALIGADVLARYFRAAGDDVLMVSGSDCHGTPIVVAAEQAKVSPAEIANKYHKEFVETLVRGVNFSYDNYTTTLTETHKKTVQKLFLDLLEKKLIYTKTEQLPYCAKCDRFLPDRYIEGECYYCHFKNARGDQCDNCGNLIDPKLLIDPRCKVCGGTPIWKDSEHFFLKLSAFQDQLEKWSQDAKGWRTNAIGFTRKLLKEGLRDRAITRDTDWGIEIPIEGYDSKRIYVWFDAVTGYLSASIEWAEKLGKGEAYKDFWQNEDAIHYYVHGKDNIPFHTLIWPAMLMGEENLHLPDRIISSEYLTLEKSQFSKSRNHAVWLPDFLANFDADILRYFLIANGPETSDADFSWQELKERINSELIANLANCVNRTVHLIKNNFPDGIEKNETEDLSDIFGIVGNLIEQGKFREALKNILLLSEKTNKHLAVTEPWKKVKENKTEAELDLYKSAIYCLTIAKLLNPFLPKTSEKIFELFGLRSPLDWQPIENTAIKVTDTTALFDKIEDKQVD
jgi:methionyl-tRNA synthetase